MQPALRGIYEDGQITFDEVPPVNGRTGVIVIFLTEEKEHEPQERVLGALEGKGKLPDDFDEPLDELKDYM